MTEERNGLRSGLQGLPGARPRPVLVAALDEPPRTKRADALRNQARVLDAAQALFAEHGVEGVTMDDIARTAGVGKGTLYRGFTDRAGLAMALLHDRAAELQAGVLSGPPPLGPGAPPTERLAAFVRAYLTFQATHHDLVLLSEGPAGTATRLEKGSYRFWRQHVAWLLGEAGAPDPVLRAEVLLGALAAEQVRHWLRVERREQGEIADRLCSVALDLARA